MEQKLQIRRINQEIKEINKDNSNNFKAGPISNDILNWHFTIRGPKDTGYENGIYHGKIEFPNNYPMSPPNIIFMTPNGRYDINVKICLSITSYHPEEWNPTWTVRTMLEGIISTFNDVSEKLMGVGGIKDYDDKEIKKLAQYSQKFVCNDCGPICKILPLVAQQSKETSQISEQQPKQNSQTDNQEEIDKKMFIQKQDEVGQLEQLDNLKPKLDTNFSLESQIVKHIPQEPQEIIKKSQPDKQDEITQQNNIKTSIFELSSIVFSMQFQNNGIQQKLVKDVQEEEKVENQQPELQNIDSSCKWKSIQYKLYVFLVFVLVTLVIFLPFTL